MTAQRSPGTGRRYPLTMICGVYRLARSSVYATVAAPALGPPGKRGPKKRVSDEELVAEIRAVSAACPFHGEGYRKVRARLAHRGRAVSGKRVLRLMRGHGLLAPCRLGPPNGNPAHDGTITTDRPDVMWGTDATRFYTEQDGWCWFFGAIDHYLDEVVGWHTAKLGDRWAALEPIRQGVRHAFGRFGKDVARGLALRCDWGPQYIADAWINEVKWLGCTISPSYVGEPECNGVAERFMRTLKEQCIYLHQFASLEEAQQLIGEFIARYNRRVAHRTPRPSDPGAGARRRPGESSVTMTKRLAPKAEGRRGSQRRLSEGTRYPSIPGNGGLAAPSDGSEHADAHHDSLLSVRETGCGTRLASRSISCPHSVRARRLERRIRA
jgi:transposase InsO family protein